MVYPHTMSQNSDATTPTAETDGDEDLDRDFILIHEAASSHQYDDLDRLSSPAARLARARGRGTFPALDDDTDRSPSDDEHYHVEIERGTITPETGYVMRFIDAELRHFPVYDLCSMVELPSFPIPDSALDSLTRQQRGILEHQGHLRIQAAYNSDTQSFEHVQQGWELPINDPLDRLMQLTERLDGRTAPAISYLVAEEGPQRWADPGVIADARGIEEQTVRQQIQEVEEALTNAESER